MLLKSTKLYPLFPTNGLTQSSVQHNPGGKIKRTLASGVAGCATFGGQNNEYRYALQRVWDESLPATMFIMMNPSVADVDTDDPTVARCQAFARSWGAGSLFVANTFAYRVTDQKQLLRALNPVGPDNDRHIIDMAHRSSTIILAYGRPHKLLRQRGIHVTEMLRRHGFSLQVLKLNQDGTPRHPLYVKGDARPFKI